VPLDLNTALNSYGFVGQLANAIPDLRSILDRAISEQWVPEQFTRTVMDSGWWKTNAESVRQLTRLQATDPATYNQNLINATNKIHLMALGQGLEGESPQKLQGIALQALLNNWDDEQIRTHLGGTLRPWQSPEGAMQGTAAQLGAHMREVATNYGVPFSEQFITDQIGQVQRGQGTLDGFDSLMRARAKATFPHLAAQIDSGMTVREIADPYIATYAQTLEVPETGVQLSDLAIQKALQVKDPTTGALSSKPMHEFVREVKNDPRWDKTKNAEEEAYRMVNRLGKDMGFLS
jgi:hypothetical protein